MSAQGSPKVRQRSATFVLPAVAFFCYLGRIQAELGHLQDGLAAIAEARSLALAAGQAFDEALVDLNEGAAWMAAGDTDRAVEVLERALGIARLHVIEWHLPSIACLLGTTLPASASLKSSSTAMLEYDFPLSGSIVKISVFDFNCLPFKSIKR